MTSSFAVPRCNQNKLIKYPNTKPSAPITKGTIRPRTDARVSRHVRFLSRVRYGGLSIEQNCNVSAQKLSPGLQGGWPFELTRVPRPSSAWGGPARRPDASVLLEGYLPALCAARSTATRFLPTPSSPGTSQRQRTRVSALHERIFGTCN